MLAGQLLLDAVRTYNTLAEVAALLPPNASDAPSAAATAVAAGAAVSSIQGDAIDGGDLPQLLRAQWRHGLPRLERVPCPPGDSLTQQAAAACARYALHVVQGGQPAAPASAVVLEEQPAPAEAAGGAQPRRGKPRGKQGGAAAPVLAVVEDRGVPISREAFAAAAGSAPAAGGAAWPDATVLAPAAAAAVSAIPLLGLVEDTAPEEDAAGTVASLMEGEARGHLYRRSALGLGSLARQPDGAAKRPKAASPGLAAARLPHAPEPAPPPAPLAAAALPEERAAAPAQPARAAAQPQTLPAAVAAAAGAIAVPNAAPAVRPAFVPVAVAAAPKPAFLSVTVAAAPTPAAAASRLTGAASASSAQRATVTDRAEAKQSNAATVGAAPTAAAVPAAPPAAQPARQPALGGAARKRKKPSASAGAAEQQQQAAALAQPKSWEDWLQPLGGGTGSEAAAGAQQQSQAGLARRQQSKRRR